ncbi:hypothetical protein WA026_022351 [Henosepilachna vigintioctopunctata]|uniref:Uncharacterized protein n=1 Tax=Henosepilachna vigintioctopunctata TaxID=420089 RepID=A0AAW1V222_9CUCU
MVQSLFEFTDLDTQFEHFGWCACTSTFTTHSRGVRVRAGATLSEHTENEQLGRAESDLVERDRKGRLVRFELADGERPEAARSNRLSR